MSEVLKFEPFTSSVNVSFWYELTRLKLDVLKLSEENVDLHGYYSIASNHTAPARFHLTEESFNNDMTLVFKLFI